MPLPTDAPPQIAVIGAGIAGLTCAWELTKAGCEVTVFEQADQVGGRMATRYVGGLAVDVGAILLLEPYAAIRHYCQELGLEPAGAPPRPLRGRTALFHAKRPYAYSAVGLLRAVLRGKLLSWRDCLRAARHLPALDRLLRASRLNFFDLVDNPDTWDHESTTAYVTREFGVAVHDYVFEPMLRAAQFHSARDLSLELTLGYLRAMLGRHYVQPPTDMGALARALAARLARVRLSQPVEAVRPGPDGGVTVSYRQAGQSRTETFDSVVLACPPGAARAMLRAPSPAQQAFLAVPQFSSTLSVTFSVPVGSFYPAWCVGIFAYPDSPVLASVALLESKGGRYVHAGRTGFVAYFQEEYVRQHDVLGWDDARVYATVRGELARLYPGVAARLARHLDDLAGLYVARYAEALPKYPPGYPSRVRAFWRNGQGHHQVYFAGDWLGSPWTEGAARTGARVARLLLTRAEPPPVAPVRATAVAADR